MQLVQDSATTAKLSGLILSQHGKTQINCNSH
jgi:hypothetical protein